MVQGEEESSWRMMASVHDHDMQHLNQAATLAYHGVGGLHQSHHHHHASAAPPASFLDFQPAAAAAAYFGELEEALINGASAAGLDPGGMITSDDVQTKCKLSFLLPQPNTEMDCFGTHGEERGDMPRLLHSHTVPTAPHHMQDRAAARGSINGETKTSSVSSSSSPRLTSFPSSPNSSSNSVAAASSRALSTIMFLYSAFSSLFLYRLQLSSWSGGEEGERR